MLYSVYWNKIHSGNNNIPGVPFAYILLQKQTNFKDVTKIMDDVYELSKKLGVKSLGVFLDNVLEDNLRRKNGINFTIPMVFS